MLGAVMPAASLTVTPAGAEKPLTTVQCVSLVFTSPSIALVWDRATGGPGRASPGLRP